MRAQILHRGATAIGWDAQRRSRVVRPLLEGLLVFGAVNAFAGGYYGMSGAAGVPTEWLYGSPFKDYFIPSLILFAIVGGSCLIAAMAVFRRWRHARVLSYAAAAVVLGWLAVQLSIIGYVSWMQPVTAALGLLIPPLASRMPPSVP